MRIVSPEVIAHLASAKKLSRAYTEDMLYREIDRLMGESKRIVADERAEILAWVEDNDADAITLREYLK